MRLKLSTVTTIIIATGVLQNIARSMHNNEVPPLPEDVDVNEIDALIQNGEIQQQEPNINVNDNLMQTRHNLINNYFSNL